jgi:hypothetical protein
MGYITLGSNISKMLLCNFIHLSGLYICLQQKQVYYCKAGRVRVFVGMGGDRVRGMGDGGHVKLLASGM